MFKKLRGAPPPRQTARLAALAHRGRRRCAESYSVFENGVACSGALPLAACRKAA